MYKILVVEDDATIAAAIVQHIQSWGFTAHCVGNFRQVLTEFVQFSPQLVLLDISLPFFNVRRYARSPKCPSSSSPQPART